MVESDANDPEEGCTFNNPRVLEACEQADEQEFFELRCRKGYDYYTKDISATFTDATLVGTDGYTWKDVKRFAMSRGYN